MYGIRRGTFLVALTATLAVSGLMTACGTPVQGIPSAASSSQPPTGPLHAACPLLSADVLGNAFGVAGLASEEGPRKVSNNDTHFECDYNKGSQPVAVMVATFSPGGADPNSIAGVLSKSDQQTGVENVDGLGNGAIFYHVTRNPSLAFLVAVKKIGADAVNVLLSIAPDTEHAATAKDTMTTLVRGVLDKIPS